MRLRLIIVVIWCCFSTHVYAQTAITLPVPLVYLAEDANGTSQVWIVDGDGQSPRQFTHGTDDAAQIFLESGVIGVFHSAHDEIPILFKVYDLSSGDLLREYTETSEPTGDFFTAAYEHRRALYRLSTGEMLYALDNRHTIIAVEENFVVLANAEHLIVFEAIIQQVVYERTIITVNDPFIDLQRLRPARANFSPDGNLLAISANGLRLLDTTGWQEIDAPILQETSLQSMGMVWSADGQQLVYEDSYNIYLLNIQTMEHSRVYEHNTGHELFYLPQSLSPNSIWLTIYTGNRHYTGLIVVNVLTRSVAYNEGGYFGPIALGWRPDNGAILVIERYNDTYSSVCIEDFETLDRYCLREDQRYFQALGWTRSGELAVVVEGDSNFYLAMCPTHELLPIACPTIDCAWITYERGIVRLENSALFAVRTLDTLYVIDSAAMQAIRIPATVSVFSQIEWLVQE